VRVFVYLMGQGYNDTRMCPGRVEHFKHFDFADDINEYISKGVK